MKKYRLATDDKGIAHVLNRTRGLCGAQVEATSAIADTIPEKMGKLLTAMDNGCMECASSVFGTRKYTSTRRKERVR
jgi:hypothetical protein